MEIVQKVLEVLNGFSLFDMIFVAAAVVGWFFGLFGKFGKKFWHLLTTCLCIAIAYFTCGIAADKILTLDSGVIPSFGEEGKTIGTLVGEKIGTALQSFMGEGADTSAFEGLISGILKMLVFWIEAIALLLTLGLVIRIIVGLAHVRAKKHTAILSLGLFGAARNVVITTLVLFPVITLAPLAQNLGDLDAVKNNELATVLLEQINESKVLEFANKFLTEYQIEPLKYETTSTDEETGEEETTTNYLYTDFNGVGKLLKLATVLNFAGGEEGEESNPVASLLEMSDDEIKDIFNSIEEVPAVKEAIVAVIDNMIPDEVEFDASEINFAEEAETFIAITTLVTTDENGEMTIDESVLEDEEKLGDIAATLAQSDLVLGLAESDTIPEGALSALDGTEAETKVEAALAEKYGAGSDEYNTFMALINGGSSSSDPATE